MTRRLAHVVAMLLGLCLGMALFVITAGGIA